MKHIKKFGPINEADERPPFQKITHEGVNRIELNLSELRDRLDDLISWVDLSMDQSETIGVRRISYIAEDMVQKINRLLK